MDYSQIISAAISAEEECGINLEDDSGFQNFFFEAEGTPEKYDGQTTTPAEPPEWTNVKKSALDYLKQSKDLKLISILSQAVLNTEGISKFSEILEGIALACESYWQNIFPPLDEDDGDPMERVSALGHLIDNNFVIRVLRDYPLAQSKVLGPVSLKQIERATDSSIEKTDQDVDLTQIRAIFKDNTPEDILQIHQSASHCIAHLNKIDQLFTDHAGSAFSTPDFEPLTAVLNHIKNALEKHAEVELSTNSQADGVAEDSEQDASNLTNSEETFQSGQNVLSFSSQQAKIRSREDVEKCIDLICDYFAEYEPSSPIPILMNRAKKLINLDFVDIVKEIAPDALEQITKLGGLSNDN